MKALSVTLSFFAVVGLFVAIMLVLQPEQFTEEFAQTFKRGVTPQPPPAPPEVKESSEPPSPHKNATSLPFAKDNPVPVATSKNNLNPSPPPENLNPQTLVQVKLYTPDTSVKFAVGDILTIPEHERKFYRYLSLYNIPEEKRPDLAKTISFMVNSLSTRRKIYIPHFVGASDETVIRLDIRDYEWKPEAWDKLAREGSGPRPFPEPYFHTFKEEPVMEKQKVKKTVKRIKKVNTGRRDYYGRPITEDKEVEEEIEVEEEVFTGARKFQMLVAPWMDHKSIVTLMELTQSESPILRADWFLANVSVAPAYYDFLKLGNNIKDFENLVFADVEAAKKSRTQYKGIVVSSIVARNNRTMFRSGTITDGYYWSTRDSKTSVGERQYAQNILNEKFDATEDIGSLPNGLQAYFLTDGKGNRLDFADPDIAIDNSAADRLVRTARSCIVCHLDGIRPIKDEVRGVTNMLADREQVKLLVTRPSDYYKIEDLFGENLDERIVSDQNFYRKAVAKANGLSSERNAVLFNQFYNDYVEYLLTKEQVSREVGVPMNQLDEYIKLSNDPIILGLVKTPIRALRRDQWEAGYHRFMTLIMAHKQGMKVIEEVPPGPLVPLEQIEKEQIEDNN